MTSRQTTPSRSRERRFRRLGALTFMSLVGIVALAVLLARFGGPATGALAAVDQPEAAPDQVHAKNEPWLEINCLETVVEEGDDFRLIVNKKFDSHWPHPTMRVFWYTDPITADETDYERLYAERQSSNGYQSEQGRMGRNFRTLEDHYPEINETFKVRFNNSVDHGHDGECIITITDDDGVGIYDLEITSEAGELDTGSGPVIAYTAGDWIEITARFTKPVAAINPVTAQPANYAGLYFQIGENRRIARLYQGNGTDTLVFSYQVKDEDLDANGIGVEAGGPGTGLYYNQETRDSGLWPVDPNTGRVGGNINRLFHGLEDDPGHKVYQVEIEEPIDEPIIAEPPTDHVPEPTFTPFEQGISARSLENPVHQEIHGELTADAGGRDWFGFDATGGENYIIELKSRWNPLESGNSASGWTFDYVDGYLLDPSILEIVDRDGNRVLGEHDGGGFIDLFGRAYFTPGEDGVYYVAVGAGSQDRSGLGHYAISVRLDDHADDYRPNPAVVLLPGGSIRAAIDSDVSPDDPGLNVWDWLETPEGYAVPIHGDESPDDRDVFRLQIAEAGTYRVSVINGPEGAGIWAIMDEGGHSEPDSRTAPQASIEFHGEPGIYLAEIGTPYRSAGNTGSYTITLEDIGG